MIEKMEKICICSLRHQTRDIMEELLKCGAVQLLQTREMIPEDMEELLEQGKSPDVAEEEALLDRLDESISILRQFGGKKGFLYKRPVVSYRKLIDEKVITDGIAVCDAVENISNRMTKLREQVKSMRFRELSLLPWSGFDMPVEEAQTEEKRTAFFILPEPRETGDIYSAADETGIALYAEEISEEKEKHYIAVLFDRKDEHDVKTVLSRFGAREFQAADVHGTIEDNILECRRKIQLLEDEISEQEEALRSISYSCGKAELAFDALSVRLKYLSGHENFMTTENVDLITGWVPASAKDDVDERLALSECCWEYRMPDDEEKPPVLVRNSRLVEPFGAITEMYSMPDPRSIDTNWIIGLFFFVFFGMMLSDAGYGLVLFIGGLLGAKFLDMGESTGRLFKMIGISGLSAVIWGALYGSWFGDAIPVAAETFFGVRIRIPALIDPLDQPMQVLVMSCLFGVVHLFAGMGIKAYIMIKRGDKWGALFDVGFWYILLAGLPLLFLQGTWKTAGILMSSAGALGLILTQGRHKPHVMGKLISGVMSLYGITGYFSDVLSYSRILALGLATGVVAGVVNIMASMAGGGIVGAVVFAAVFIAGHLLNLGINALGAYVHSARLQYVEFFGKYYEGGGKKFEPLKMDTKYVRVMGEDEYGDFWNVIYKR